MKALAVVCMAFLASSCINQQEDDVSASKIQVASLPSKAVSGEHVKLAGQNLDTTLSLYVNGTLISIDTLRPDELIFSAPWPRGEYSAYVKNTKDSIWLGSFTVTRAEGPPVLLPDGWYRAPVVTLTGVKGKRWWIKNDDGSYSHRAVVISESESDNTPWISISRGGLHAGNSYDKEFGGGLTDSKTSFDFTSTRIWRHEVVSGSGEGPKMVTSTYTFSAKDLDVRMVGDTLVATGRGNLAAYYVEGASNPIYIGEALRTAPTSEVLIKLAP